jgi:hypothetical protein
MTYNNEEHTKRMQAVLDAVHEYHRLFIHDTKLDQAKVEKAFDELKDSVFNIDDLDFTKVGGG